MDPPPYWANASVLPLCANRRDPPAAEQASQIIQPQPWGQSAAWYADLSYCTTTVISVDDKDDDGCDDGLLGGIPAWLSALVNLTDLNLGYNQFNGENNDYSCLYHFDVIQ